LPIVVGRINNRHQANPEMIMQKHARNGASLDDLVIHLLHRVAQRGDELFDKEVDGVDLTARQFTVLLAVAKSEDPSQTDVVEITGIDRSTIAEMIRRMAKKGLLQRRRSRKDARAYVVRLTPAGQRVLKTTEPQALRAGTAVLASLSSEQRKTFLEALKVIAAA
jgi:DNA-binding MarR family transcriptional regulator